MILTFKYGFDYKGFSFGWLNKELYRLPIFKDKRSYTLKKLSKIKINGKDGYRVYRDRKTVVQLAEITEKITYNHCINGNGSNDCPF